MAGGIFSSMNKVRPGAYINFEMNKEVNVALGSRGIATVAMNLSWGEDNKLIELSAQDMIYGDSLAKIGLVSTDTEAKLLNMMLENCSMVKLYKLNTSGSARATKTISLDEEDETKVLTITAKYAGAFGNNIAVLVRSTGNSYIVETYADGYAVDSQVANTVEDLKANDFVTFSGTGNLIQITSTLLENGQDGSMEDFATAYSNYFAVLRTSKWNTMAVPVTDSDIVTLVINFIRDLRENDGRYVQAVLANQGSADYEGIINNVCGVVLEDGTSVNANNFTYWVAGATAGADITESLTGKIIENAVSIVNSLTNNEIIEGLKEGKFILSLNQNGNVKVEKDINSLHTFTPSKTYIFSKNRIIRELDEIGSSVQNIWETSYLGKVSNNDNGRTLFKSSIINYLSELANKAVIQNFDSEAVEVLPGNDIDSVIANIAIQPVDSMEMLYMTININA